MVQGDSFKRGNIILTYFLHFWQLHNGAELVAVNGNPEASAYGFRIGLGDGKPQPAAPDGRIVVNDEYAINFLHFVSLSIAPLPVYIFLPVQAP